MHELAICQALVAELQALAEREGGRVLRARVSIGVLAGVEPDLLEAAFPIASAGTQAEGARLELLPLVARVRCRICGAESEASPNRLICAACGDWRTELVSGDELTLTQVEIDREAAHAAALS